MPRLNVVDPATAPTDTKAIFDGPLKGKHINIFKGMGNSAAALQWYVNASGALGKGALSGKEVEVISLAISEENACDYCLAAHTMLGKGAGLSEAQTVGARRGKIDDDAKLNALATFAKSLHEKKGHVSDDDLAAFKNAGYDDGAIAEVVAAYATITFTNYFNHINDTVVDFPAPPSL